MNIHEFYKLCCLPEKLRKDEKYKELKSETDEFIVAIEKYVQAISDEPDKPVKLVKL